MLIHFNICFSKIKSAAPKEQHFPNGMFPLKYCPRLISICYVGFSRQAHIFWLMHSPSCLSPTQWSLESCFPPPSASTWIGALRSSVESCNSPETDKACAKLRLMLASATHSCLPLAQRSAVGQRGFGTALRRTACTAPRGVCNSHTRLFCRWPEHLIDLRRVPFGNMHTLAGPFSKPHLFFFSHPAPTSKSWMWMF